MAATTTTGASSPKDGNVNIRLRRLDSKNSVADSTYSETLTLPPYTTSNSLSKPTDPFLSATSSAASSVRSSSVYSDAATNFIPTSRLHIESLGKKRISLPLSSNELEIAILACENEIQTEAGYANNVDVGADGTKYVSIRPERKSGSCFLIRGGDASETPIASTTYFFGPGRNPKIWIGDASTASLPKYTPDPTATSTNHEIDTSTGTTFEMVSKKLLSRTVRFETASHGTFEWRYASKAERKALSNPPPNNLLLLERVSLAKTSSSSSKKESKSKSKEERVLVARLVRGEDTRTRGSSSCSAGNGGLLEMCLASAGAGADEKREQVVIIDEVTVLVTCMVMLKKEIDRLRTIQIAVIAGAVSS